jgi:hypothetical protein
MLTGIHLCHACSYHEVEDGNGPDRDLNDGGLLAQCGGGPIDYVIISYVLIYCTNNQTADMLASLLHQDRVRAIIIRCAHSRQRCAQL